MSFCAESGYQRQQMKDNLNYTQHRDYEETGNTERTPLGRRGRLVSTAENTPNSSTRNRSVKLSLNRRNAAKGESISVTVELENPDEMVENVLQALSSKYPLQTLLESMGTPKQSSRGEVSPNTGENVINDSSWLEPLKADLIHSTRPSQLNEERITTVVLSRDASEPRQPESLNKSDEHVWTISNSNSPSVTKPYSETNRTETGVNEEMNQSTKITVHSINENLPRTQSNQIQFSRDDDNLEIKHTHSIRNVDSPIYKHQETASDVNAGHLNLLRMKQSPIYSPETDHHRVDMKTAPYSAHTIMQQDSASAGNSPGLSNLSYRDVSQKWQNHPSVKMTPELVETNSKIYENTIYNTNTGNMITSQINAAHINAAQIQMSAPTGVASGVQDPHVIIHETQMNLPIIDAMQMSGSHINDQKFEESGSALQRTELQMTSPQMNASQMNASQMTYPQMTSPKMASPQMTSPQMNASQMTYPQMTYPQMTYPQMTSPKMASPQMNASQMTYPQMTSPKMTSPKMTASQMTASQMTSPKMTSPQMNASQMTSPKMTASQMTSPKIIASQMTSPQMTASQMTSPKMNASQMTSPQMNASQMTSPKMNASQMTSPKMNNAVQMTIRGIDALHMTTPKLDASQTNAPLMNAAEISGWQMNSAHYSNTNHSEATILLSRGISETNTSTQHVAQTNGINYQQATESRLHPDFTHNGAAKLDSSSPMSDSSTRDAVNSRLANSTMNQPSSANPTSGSAMMNASDANQHRKNSSQMTSSHMNESGQTIPPGTVPSQMVTSMDVSANLSSARIKDTSYVDTTIPGNHYQTASVAQTVVRNRSPQVSEGLQDETRDTVMGSPQMRNATEMPKSIISNLSPKMLPVSTMKTHPGGMMTRPARMDASELPKMVSADSSEMFASSIMSSSVTRSPPTTMLSGLTGSATKSSAPSYGVPMAGSPLMKLAGSPGMSQCSSPLNLKSSSSFHKMDSPMHTDAHRSPQTMATNFPVVATNFPVVETSSEQTSSRVVGSVETSGTANLYARSPLIPPSDYNCGSVSVEYSFAGGNLFANNDSPPHSKATSDNKSTSETVLQQSAAWPSKASSVDVGTDEVEQMNSLQSSAPKSHEFSSVTLEMNKNYQSELHHHEHRSQPVSCCSHSSQNHHETHESVVIPCQHDLSTGHLSQKSPQEMSKGVEPQLDDCQRFIEKDRDTQIRNHDKSHHTHSSSKKSNDASQQVNRNGGSVGYTRRGSQHSSMEPKTTDGQLRVRGVGEVIDTSYGGLLMDARLPPPVLSAEGSMSRSDLSQNVFEAEGKWETLNEEDVLADKETEHSKSGSRSRMDESSFLESTANGLKIKVNTNCREDWSYETFSALANKMDAKELAQLLSGRGDFNYNKFVSDVSRSLAVSPEVVEKFVNCVNDKPQFRSLCTELVAGKVSDAASMSIPEVRRQENIQRHCNQHLMEQQLSIENNWLLGSSHACATEKVPQTEMNNLMSMVTKSPTMRTMLAPDDSVRAFLRNLKQANAYGSSVLVHVSHYLPSLLEDRIPDYLNQYREELGHDTVCHIAAAVEAFGRVLEQLGCSPLELDSELNNLVSRAGTRREWLTNESEFAELSLIHEAVREASLRYAVDRLLRLTMRSNNQHIVNFCENFRRSFNLLEWIWSRVPTAVSNFVSNIAAGHGSLAPVVTRTFVYPTNEPAAYARAAYATVTVQREYESPTWSGVCPQQPREILYLERDSSPIRRISDVNSSPLRKIGARVP